MTEIKFEKIPIEEKKVLLDIIGYGISEGGLLTNKKTNKVHSCPITNEPVFIEDASIVPGSTLVIKTTELSLAEYFTKFVEKIPE